MAAGVRERFKSAVKRLRKGAQERQEGGEVFKRMRVRLEKKRRWREGKGSSGSKSRKRRLRWRGVRGGRSRSSCKNSNR